MRLTIVHHEHGGQADQTTQPGGAAPAVAATPQGVVLSSRRCCGRSWPVRQGETPKTPKAGLSVVANGLPPGSVRGFPSRGETVHGHHGHPPRAARRAPLFPPRSAPEKSLAMPAVAASVAAVTILSGLAAHALVELS